jgi:hypothetical protein
MNNNTHLTELGHSPDALAQRQVELLANLQLELKALEIGLTVI